MILTYSTGIEISTVENYLQGFIEVKMSDQIQQLTGFLVQTINDDPVMVLYHEHRLPTVRTAAPNQFAYLCRINEGTIRNRQKENSSEKGMYSEWLFTKKKDQSEPEKETLSNYSGETEQKIRSDRKSDTK